jgi:hypothetical protein
MGFPLHVEGDQEAGLLDMIAVAQLLNDESTRF